MCSASCQVELHQKYLCMRIELIIYIVILVLKCILLSGSYKMRPNILIRGRVGFGASYSRAASNKAGGMKATKNEKDIPSVITPRHVDYSLWYNDVIYAADMIDQSPVRGCMVIKPWGMGIWDILRSELDKRIRDTGANNAYFPLFIPQSFLSKEAEHVDGFAKECAVVTHHRLCINPENSKELMPDPLAKLEEPLIVRPTSETVIWSMLAKWIRSYRDLPMKINQWANVVRWEMRTRPFLRTSEFLWQEGHTAHASEECARNTVKEALELYADTCEHLLAMPTIKGAKSPSERFAGAEDTHTIEAMMQNGWALQSGTSHFLGQNFSRAFDVYYQNAAEGRELVWATSWGVSTRLIGAMVMTHSDDKGLVLPPRVAPVQVVIVPITKGPTSAAANMSEGDDSGSEHSQVMQKVAELETALKRAGVRVKVDTRWEMRPGAKYFDWERKGLPLRIDLGARDLQKQQAVLAARHTGQKETVGINAVEDFVHTVQKCLDNMHIELLSAAQQRLAAHTVRVESYEVMRTALSGEGVTPEGMRAGFFLVPWKCDAVNEAAVKEDCKATIRCYPFEHNQLPPAPGVKCFYSGEQATHMAIFARAF